MLITVASEAIEKGGGQIYQNLEKKKNMVMVSQCLTLLLKKKGGGAKPPPPGSDAYGNSVTIQRQNLKYVIGQDCPA